MHISVCVCSYQRPALLKRTLIGLSAQDTKGQFEYSVVVCDNDDRESARAVVSELSPKSPQTITYCCEPRRGIAHARNTALDNATGDAIAFIDDDEVPDEQWLYHLYDSQQKQVASAVLGPVRPYFDGEPPAWILKAGLCNRPEHPTGYMLAWSECRTGNVLFKKEITQGIQPVFRAEMVTGSDVDFFLRLAQKGHKFTWCNEAVVYELVPPNRWKRSFMLKRALLRGGNMMRRGHLPPRVRLLRVGTSAIAVPLYTAMLPFLQLRGHHLFMKYLIKWCDHFGRLLGFFNIEPVREREV
jgi:cellulose synthase/poly-beta-1,6-N-acetylglucosamine synthase-like glycosyltransferase